jgi:hypothetical protein
MAINHLLVSDGYAQEIIETNFANQIYKINWFHGYTKLNENFIKILSSKQIKAFLKDLCLHRGLNPGNAVRNQSLNCWSSPVSAAEVNRLSLSHIM